jgi:hypothetical protein
MTALALYGCGSGSGVEFAERDFVCAEGENPPCATTVAAHSKDERTAEPGNELSNATLTYVIDTLSLPDVTDGKAAGFNLDGYNSGNGNPASERCVERQPDFVSITDPDHVGVDNSLQGLAGFLGSLVAEGECEAAPAPLDCVVLNEINEGTVILLLRVSGVDSLANDPEIELQLLLGELPEGKTLEVTDGRLAPGQEFNVAMELGQPVQGDIFDGRLRASTPQMLIPIAVEDTTIDLVITNPELRFDISESGLTNGAIGGVITIATLQAAADVFEEGFDVGAVVAPYTDMATNADAADCDALSVGILFTATTATAN